MSVNRISHCTNPSRMILAGVLILLAASALWTLTHDRTSRLQTGDSTLISTTALQTTNPTLPPGRHQASTKPNQTSRLVDLTVTTTTPSLTERCKAIESKALRKLNQLHTSLNLTKVQRQRVFSILVRSDAGYDPAMRVSGETGAAAIVNPNDAMVEVLDPDRQEKFEQTLIDNASWWDAAIAKMESARVEESATATSQGNEESTETNFR